MNPKKEEQKIPKNKIVPKKAENISTNTNNINTNNNITINKRKNSKLNISNKDSRQYNVQLTILDQSKKLKISLEITEGPKLKRVYIKTLTLEELISLNNFFAQFKDYSEAFDFLLKNFTKIDRNKIVYLNNNNDIKVILLFALGEEDNDIIEDTLEITLHKHVANNINKSLSNINLVINNLKSSLEKFNLSIKELKSNVQKDKIEKDKRINELEQIFNNKISELNQEILTKNLSKEEKGEKSFDIIIEDIFNKIEKQNEYIEDIKKEMEENDINQRNDINNNNKIFMEKENELAKLITEKFDDFIKRINSYDEKNIELENNFNDKITDLDNKTNICFNELIKKINAKNNNYKQNSQQENDLTEQLNEVINNLLQENENLEKRLENKLEEKINELMINNIKTLEEKINLLEKNSEEKTNKKNDNNKIENEELSNINSILKEKFEELEQFKNVFLSKLEENKNNINDNKININNINERIDEIKDEINKNTNIEKDIENIKKENDKKINNIQEENQKIFDELNNKYLIKFEEENKEFNKKLRETKEDINKMIKNINDLIKNNSNDLNNKISLLKTDIIKKIEEKDNLLDNKIITYESKLSSFETKLNKIPKKDNNSIFFDNNNIIEYKSDSKKDNDNEKYSSKTLEKKHISLKHSKKNFKKSNLSKTLTEINPESSYNITEKDSDSSDKKNIRNSFFISSSNLFSSHLREKTNVFDLAIDSNILKKETISENFFIFTKLKEIYAYNRYIKLNLIYRASRDGDSAKDFHFKCDFIGPNITFIKTKKQYVFGGFTIKTWKHLFKDINMENPECGTELKDEQAFGFSLNKSKIYENGKQDESIIYCNSNYGPCFKNFFFKIFDKCFENGGICGTILESNFIGIEQEFEINGGEQYFTVEEIEVFQIAFR